MIKKICELGPYMGLVVCTVGAPIALMFGLFEMSIASVTWSMLWCVIIELKHLRGERQ